jgi:serine/threonine protein kinase
MSANQSRRPGPETGAPPHPAPPPESDDPRVIAALEEYLEAIENGLKPNRQAFLARHADVAQPLAECLDGMEALHGAASSASSPVPLSSRAAGDGPTPAGLAGGWHPGTVVGDFRIIREVGRGGMGVVFEAEQVSLGRRIAVKVLPFAFTLDARQLQRFKNEARAAAQLHHGSIVPIYQVGCERSVHFYAMQYIEGQTLAEVIGELRQAACRRAAAAFPAEGPALPKTVWDEPTGGSAGAGQATRPVGKRAGPAADTAHAPSGPLATAYSTDGPGFFRAVARLGVQAAEALEHAHVYGVVHRDIKPGNLLVDANSHLWVTDFGLAQFQGETALTRTGDLLGTLRYMSPEQALAKRGVVDHRTDIYSLGATLYELLTLAPPYGGRDRQELLRQIAFEEPRAPRRLNPAIPADLETIVLKAMAKGVGERYATAQELADDLRRFLEHKPIRARRPTALERTAKWARRHRGLVATAVAVLALLAVGFGISTALVAREQWKTKDALNRVKEEQQKTKEALRRAKQRTEEAHKAYRRAEKSFRQARAAVDLLTQVAETELANHPYLTGLRRRLLELALVYYHGFVNERRNDPSSREKLEATQERVEAILAELSAFEGFGRAMFLTHMLQERAVQKDLGLSPEQIEKVREMSADWFHKSGPLFSTLRQLDPEGRRKRFKEMTRDAEQGLAGLLTPDQLDRLRQIALQKRGPQALGEAEVARALGLTEAQKKRIQTILAEDRRGMPPQPDPGGPPGKGRGPGPGPHDQALRDRLLAVLTVQQRTQWDKMTGKPFQGETCPRGRGGFGRGPKFGRRGGP